MGMVTTRKHCVEDAEPEQLLAELGYLQGSPKMWEAANAILRKSWMRAPILATIFGATYFCSTQLPQKFFQKLTNRRVGQTPENYKG